MCTLHVRIEVAFLCECHLADWALVRSFTAMLSHVCFKCVLLIKRSAAFHAGKRSFTYHSNSNRNKTVFNSLATSCSFASAVYSDFASVALGWCVFFVWFNFVSFWWLLWLTFVSLSLRLSLSLCLLCFFLCLHLLRIKHIKYSRIIRWSWLDKEAVGRNVDTSGERQKSATNLP